MILMCKGRRPTKVDNHIMNIVDVDMDVDGLSRA